MLNIFTKFHEYRHNEHEGKDGKDETARGSHGKGGPEGRILAIDEERKETKDGGEYGQEHSYDFMVVGTDVF